MDTKTYQTLVDYLTKHEFPLDFNTQEKQRLSKMAIYYTVKNGILFKHNRKNPENLLRVIFLQDKDKLLYNYHSSPLGGGHFGIKKTVENVMRNYYWPTMGKDIREYIETCDVCQRIGKPQKDQTIIPIKVVNPFEQIGIDFVGPLKISSKGNRYIIVATDYLTKWPEARPLKVATANEVAKFLYEEIITKHGVPTSILSDHGTAFLGRVIKLLKEEVGFRHKLAATYHPQTNGLTERFNGTLCRALHKCVNDGTAEWDDLIPSVLFAYRTLNHSTTKFSPFFLLYGREAQLPIDLELKRETETESPYEEALSRRISHILGTFTDALILAKDNIESVQQMQVERSKKLEKAIRFEVDDLVILYDAAKQNVHGDKFTSRWTGPYYVHKKLGDKTVVLRDKIDPTKIGQPINTSLLRHYKQRQSTN